MAHSSIVVAMKIIACMNSAPCTEATADRVFERDMGDMFCARYFYAHEAKDYSMLRPFLKNGFDYDLKDGQKLIITCPAKPNATR